MSIVLFFDGAKELAENPRDYSIAASKDFFRDYWDLGVMVFAVANSREGILVTGLFGMGVSFSVGQMYPARGC